MRGRKRKKERQGRENKRERERVSVFCAIEPITTNSTMRSKSFFRNNLKVGPLKVKTF